MNTNARAGLKVLRSDHGGPAILSMTTMTRAWAKTRTGDHVHPTVLIRVGNWLLVRRERINVSSGLAAGRWPLASGVTTNH